MNLIKQKFGVICYNISYLILCLCIIYVLYIINVVFQNYVRTAHLI